MRNQLRELNDIDVPDVRDRIGKTTRFTSIDVGRMPRSGGRLGAGAVATVIFLFAALFAWRAFSPDGSTSPGQDAGFFIAVDPTTQNIQMGALLRAPLVVRNGCVLLGDDSAISLPVWPRGFTAGLDESGRVVIRDTDDQVVAIEGQPVEVGGGYIAEFQPAAKVDPKDEQVARVESGLGYQVPDACLSGIYGIWQVGDTTPIDSSS